ncbi:U-box domain-containing protein 32-like isoform X2 [Silene latifolia]|uniref:U-box domain-containing protein 32-like isoform X2 n=1 Tax=Silene latifolia TaxID=37657 RepID=UPI003D787C89
MESLEKLKERRVAALSGPQFPTFSLIEICEATCGFDPSKKIRDGTYGSIYQRMLGHMEGAVRMLPNDGIQGLLMFEHQERNLSQIFCQQILIISGYQETGSTGHQNVAVSFSISF